MEELSSYVVAGVSFGRTVIGMCTRPYETYRRIAKHATQKELVYVAFFIGAYFLLASLVKVAAFRPFFLTRQFFVLLFGALSGVVVSVGSILLAARLLRLSVSRERVFVSWVYTLIPTVLWFFVTSVLYVLLPPPRTTSAAGVIFSAVFLVFSATILWWKIVSSYLVLRFCLRCDLSRAFAVAGISAPLVGAWAYAMYRLHVFTVPFL